MIHKLIEESSRPASIASTHPPPIFQNRLTPASPSLSSPKRSSLTPPLSPSAYDKLSQSHSQSLPPEGLQIIQNTPQPKLQPSAPERPIIPQFFFPKGKPIEPEKLDNDLKMINQAFMKENLRINEFVNVVKDICGLPKILFNKIFASIAGDRELINKAGFLKYWKSEYEGKSIVQRLFNTLRKPQNNYFERDDFRPLMRVLMDTHPGLDFLKATPEFQERYADTVVERIFFLIDANDDGKITLRELKRSNLLDIMLSLDEEEDINKIKDYFSYEHFYVLYCKFWEIDTDHDFYIDKEDFSRYDGHTLSRKAIDRIFEQIPRKFRSDIPGKMSYDDFIWFMISEEDKTSIRSLEYWFKVVDLDQNGIITAYEMEHFYEEQLHRLEYLNQEAVPFKDVLCQMADMIKPKTENQFKLEDFKAQRAITGVFFNCLLNLNKFVAYEQRDPFSLKHEQTENPGFTDWDRYALTEYVRLAMEEENAENSEMLDEVWDSDHEDN